MIHSVTEAAIVAVVSPGHAMLCRDPIYIYRGYLAFQVTMVILRGIFVHCEIIKKCFNNDKVTVDRSCYSVSYPYSCSSGA